MSLADIFEPWKPTQRAVLSHGLEGRDALLVERVARGQAGQELALLLRAVGGEVLVDRGRELALLERLGEVVALVGA